MKNIIKLIFSLENKYKYLILIIVLLALIISFAEVSVIASLGEFLKSVTSLEGENFADIPSRLKVELNQKTFRFLSIVILCGILRVILLFIQYKVAAKISAKVGLRSFANITGQEYLNLKSSNQSNFLSIMVQDVPRTQEAITNFTNFISNGILLLSIIIVLVIIDTNLFLASIFLVGLAYISVVKFFSGKLRIAGNNITKYNHEEVSLVRSSLGSIIDLLVNNSLLNQVKSYNNIEKKLRINYANSLFYTQSPRFIVETVIYFLVGAFIYFSLNIGESITIFAQLGTLAVAFNRALPASQQIYSAYAFIKASNASIEKVISTSSLVVKENTGKSFSYKIRDKSNFIDIKNKFQSQSSSDFLQISDLSFRYPNTREIIRYPDYQFFPSRPTAIIGESGSGKSTLIELMLNLLVPNTGDIKYHNYSTSDINPEVYREDISYLSQNPFLFSGTIFENINFGLDNTYISKKELTKLGEKLGLTEEFGKDFLNYSISDFGRNISGGQAQRCKLLKILANPKPIIILDEPTSSLDEESIIKFNKLLIKKSAKSILIVITHSKIDLEFYPNILDLSKKI